MISFAHIHSLDGGLRSFACACGGRFDAGPCAEPADVREAVSAWAKTHEGCAALMAGARGSMVAFTCPICRAHVARLPHEVCALGSTFTPAEARETKAYLDARRAEATAILHALVTPPPGDEHVIVRGVELASAVNALGLPSGHYGRADIERERVGTTFASEGEFTARSEARRNDPERPPAEMPEGGAE